MEYALGERVFLSYEKGACYNQSGPRVSDGPIIVTTLSVNPSSPPFNKGRHYPSLEKRGEGRF